MGSVWSASQGRQGDTGNKLAFLTLAQVSLPPFIPPPQCPSSSHFKGQLDDNTPLLSSTVGIYSDEKLLGLTCIIGSEFYEFIFYMRTTGCGQDDY